MKHSVVGILRASIHTFYHVLSIEFPPSKKSLYVEGPARQESCVRRAKRRSKPGHPSEITGKDIDDDFYVTMSECV